MGKQYLLTRPHASFNTVYNIFIFSIFSLFQFIPEASPFCQPTSAWMVTVTSTPSRRSSPDPEGSTSSFPPVTATSTPMSGPEGGSRSRTPATCSGRSSRPFTRPTARESCSGTSSCESLSLRENHGKTHWKVYRSVLFTCLLWEKTDYQIARRGYLVSSWLGVILCLPGLLFTCARVGKVSV